MPWDNCSWYRTWGIGAMACNALGQSGQLIPWCNARGFSCWVIIRRSLFWGSVGLMTEKDHYIKKYHLNWATLKCYVYYHEGFHFRIDFVSFHNLRKNINGPFFYRSYLGNDKKNKLGFYFSNFSLQIDSSVCRCVKQYIRNADIWPECLKIRVCHLLTHWGQVTHICVRKLTINGSGNGLSPGRRQAIILTSAGLLLIGPLGTNFSEISIGTQTFTFKKMHLKISSAKWRPCRCLGLNVLMGACGVSWQIEMYVY